MATRHITPLRTQILTALAAGELHTYGIYKQMIADVQGALFIKQRHVYTAIPTLLKEDLIEPGQTEGTYRLTRQGRQTLRWELGRLQHLTHLLRPRITP